MRSTGIILTLLGLAAAGTVAGVIYDDEEKKKCQAAGGTWNGIFKGCVCPAGTSMQNGKCVSGSGPVITTLPMPTGFKITVPATMTSATGACTASWNPVAEMVSGDYYALTVSAGGSPLFTKQVPMGTTSYQFSAPAGASLSGLCAACSPS